jgi:ABC-type nickel/cobalt efflux system permease component RcnA
MDRAFAGELMTRCRGALAVAVASLVASPAWAHDIPNQRIDRSIQVEVAPQRLDIDYEVSLTELTLVQDLRALLGSLPKADSDGLLDLYARVTGPLNAKGFLVTLDGRPADLAFRGFRVVVEEHPRFTFHFDLPMPDRGSITIHDTNFATSEGTSRLAVRSRRVVIESDSPLPADVAAIAIRPVWQLTDDEERQTKQARFRFGQPVAGQDIASDRARNTGERGSAASGQRVEFVEPGRRDFPALPRLSRMLDATGNLPWLVLCALAVALGAVHALQPGHGKTLVTAVALGPEARFYQPAILGVAATIAHTGSVLVIASVLWWTGTSEVVRLHLALTRAAGFAIAAAGFWRLGRHLAGYRVHDDLHTGSVRLSNFGLVGLGLAGGLVPCWDAVALIVLAAAVGRLAAGVGLVLAFGAGMGLVLVTLGAMACQARAVTLGLAPTTGWQTKLGIASASILAVIGLFLFLQ